jgi:hypothetical protein
MLPPNTWKVTTVEWNKAHLYRITNKMKVTYFRDRTELFKHPLPKMDF